MGEQGQAIWLGYNRENLVEDVLSLIENLAVATTPSLSLVFDFQQCRASIQWHVAGHVLVVVGHRFGADERAGIELQFCAAA
jgi:hypothetical protein